MLLQVVAFARDVGGHFNGVGKTHTSHFAKRRVRLLRSGGINAGADTTTLRAALESWRGCLGDFAFPTFSN